MSKFLVVSDPPVKPGYLPRLRYLCEYLVRKGHDVTLVTEQTGDLNFPHTYPIVPIKLYNGSKFDWFVKTVWTLLTDWYNRAFAKKTLYTLHLTHSTFDAVICTTFNDSPLGAAQRIAKAWGIPLVCDIRDLDEQVEDSRYQYRHRSPLLMPFRRLYRAVHIRRRNKVLRAANAVTTVSKWHAEFIKAISNQQSAISVIYNGFDEKQFYPEDIKTERFTVTYIGSLFEWQQPALEKIKSSISNLQYPIVLDLHTPQHDPIPFDELGDAIRRSSIMVVLTDTRTHGMLTTKFYEALGCEKPVLCVPSDQGELAELIEYTHAGIATDDPETIKAFIEEKYKEWKTNGYTRQVTTHRNAFSRENQCNHLEEIIKTLIA